LFDVLIAVKWLNCVVFAQATEGVDQMGTEVGVDVLWRELGFSLSEKKKESMIKQSTIAQVR
jgi:hypothetical protein